MVVRFDQLTGRINKIKTVRGVDFVEDMYEDEAGNRAVVVRIRK